MNTTTNGNGVSRYAQWQYHSPALLLAAGHRAPLMICVGNKKDFYWVERLDTGGWRLFKEQPDGSEPAVYDIDTSFGPDPERDWSCDCPAGCFRRWQKVCKHITAVVAALKHIGVKP